MKRNKKYIITSILLLIIVLILTSLIYNLSTSQKVLTKNNNDKIKIGVLAALTGPAPDCGEDMKIGLESAISVLKKQGKDNIELLYEDTKANPQTSTLAANKLINQDKVKIIIGACSSSSTLAVAPIAEENKIILLTTVSMADEISQSGDYVFRSILTPSQDAPLIAKLIKEELKKDKIAIFYLSNAYGESYNTVFTKEFENLGGKIIISEASSAAETNARSILLKIKENNIDTVFMPHTATPSATFLKQAKELNLNLTIISTNLMEREAFTETAGELANGLYYTTINNIKNPSQSYIDFKSEKDKLYPTKRVSAQRTTAYDAIIILNSAIEKCNEDANCIKDYLYNIKNYNGAAGTFSVNENGDFIYEKIYLNQMTQNGIIQVSEIDNPYK